jgi:hypothetical protein
MPVALEIDNLEDSFEQQTYGPQPIDRRKEPRRRIYDTHWLTISSVTANFSSFLVARLIDVSDGGFGLCTLEPVEPGDEYAVAGEVQVDDQWLEISGHARVSYCKSSKEDTYRVGLAATGISCRDISRAKLTAADHEGGGRRT